MNIISRLFLYLFGTLRLKISGEYCERLLNIMASNNISFWKTKKSDGYFYVTVLRKDIKKIRLLKRNTSVHIKIIKKSGFPLIYKKYKKRYGLLLGILFFIAVINFMSTRLWMIRINGNITVTAQEMRDFFISCGISEGVAMNNIDSDIIKQKLILSFNNVAWASINKQGAVIEVNLTEFTPNEISDLPCNIVSNYDAVIKRVDVTKGSVNVKIGDTVTKKQILVSGIVNYGAGNSFVHSNGKIIGEIRFNETIKIKKIQETINPTGHIFKRNKIQVLGKKMPLYLGSVYGDYTVNNTHKYLRIFGEEVPIAIYSSEYMFVNRTYSQITKNQAIEISDNKLLEKLGEESATNIDFQVIREDENKDEYIFEYSIVCFIDIGEEVLIMME